MNKAEYHKFINLNILDFHYTDILGTDNFIKPLTNLNDNVKKLIDECVLVIIGNQENIPSKQIEVIDSNIEKITNFLKLIDEISKAKGQIIETRENQEFTEKRNLIENQINEYVNEVYIERTIPGKSVNNLLQVISLINVLAKEENFSVRSRVSIFRKFDTSEIWLILSTLSVVATVIFLIICFWHLYNYIFNGNINITDVLSNIVVLVILFLANGFIFKKYLKYKALKNERVIMAIKRELRRKIKIKSFHGRLYFSLNDYFFGIPLFLSIASFGLAAILFYFNTDPYIRIILIIVTALGMSLSLIRITAKFGDRSKHLLEQKEIAIDLLNRIELNLLTEEQICDELKKLGLSDTKEPTT